MIARSSTAWSTLWVCILGLLDIFGTCQVSAEESSHGAQRDFSKIREMNKRMIEAYRTGAWVYLGANGEFIGGDPGIYYSNLISIAAPILVDGDELAIMNPLQPFEEYARVLSDGTIVHAGKVKSGIPQENAPDKWPFLNADGSLSAMPRRGQLVAKVTLSKSEAGDGPEGNAGWAILCARDCLIFPDQDQARPEVFVWLVPQTLPAFRAIFSDNRPDKLYFEVSSDRKITFGSSVTGLTERERTESYWPHYALFNEIETIMPQGCLVAVPGYWKGSRFLYKDNVLVGMSMRPPVPHE